MENESKQSASLVLLIVSEQAIFLLLPDSSQSCACVAPRSRHTTHQQLTSLFTSGLRYTCFEYSLIFLNTQKLKNSKSIYLKHFLTIYLKELTRGPNRSIENQSCDDHLGVVVAGQLLSCTNSLWILFFSATNSSKNLWLWFCRNTQIRCLCWQVLNPL